MSDVELGQLTRNIALTAGVMGSVLGLVAGTAIGAVIGRGVGTVFNYRRLHHMPDPPRDRA